jgi:hypothetical protein
MFALLLRHIFNTSLLQGKFPTLWKQAAVAPIFKRGNSTQVTNYRPITIILNNFSKNFESIIHDQLSFYFRLAEIPGVAPDSVRNEGTGEIIYLFCLLL